MQKRQTGPQVTIPMIQAATAVAKSEGTGPPPLEEGDEEDEESEDEEEGEELQPPRKKLVSGIGSEPTSGWGRSHVRAEA